MYPYHGILAAYIAGTLAWRVARHKSGGSKSDASAASAAASVVSRCAVLLNWAEASYVLLLVYFVTGVWWELAFTGALVTSIGWAAFEFAWSTPPVSALWHDVDVHVSNLCVALLELCVNRPNFALANWWHALLLLLCHFVLHVQRFVVSGRWRYDAFALGHPQRPWPLVCATHTAYVFAYAFAYAFGYWLHTTLLGAYVFSSIACGVVVFGVSVWLLDRDVDVLPVRASRKAALL